MPPSDASVQEGRHGLIQHAVDGKLLLGLGKNGVYSSYHIQLIFNDDHYSQRRLLYTTNIQRRCLWVSAQGGDYGVEQIARQAPAGMKRILIIRLSALGDVVMASSLIPALRICWPDAHLAEVCEMLLDAGIRGPIAVLCPFTTRPQKHWFEARWIGLAEQLWKRGYTSVALFGSTRPSLSVGTPHAAGHSTACSVTWSTRC